MLRLLAQAPTFDPVVFPIDPASVVAEVAIAGAVLIGLSFGVMIAFRMIKKLLTRTSDGVMGGVDENSMYWEAEEARRTWHLGRKVAGRTATREEWKMFHDRTKWQ